MIKLSNLIPRRRPKPDFTELLLDKIRTGKLNFEFQNCVDSNTYSYFIATIRDNEYLRIIEVYRKQGVFAYSPYAIAFMESATKLPCDSAKIYDELESRRPQATSTDQTPSESLVTQEEAKLNDIMHVIKGL